MATKGARHVALTGVPGVGKTTLVRRACDALRSAGLAKQQGFFTEEVRQGGRRTGFDVVTLDGRRAPLARVDGAGAGAGPGSGGRRGPRVGQFVVDLPSFEQTALSTLSVDTKSAQPALVVIDEIGKMELFSRRFPAAVQAVLDAPNVVALITIPVPGRGRPLPLVEEIRARSDVTVITVTRENRDGLLKEISPKLEQCIKPPT